MCVSYTQMFVCNVYRAQEPRSFSSPKLSEKVCLEVIEVSQLGFEGSEN